MDSLTDGPPGPAIGPAGSAQDGHAPAPVPDLDGDAFRRWGGEVVERIAAMLEHPDALPVLPRIQPGDLLAAIPAAPPARGEPFDRILADYDRLIPPATTHWNHPGFLAYFAITGSAPGILAEALAAALNVNAMLWRTGPAQTELEQAMMSWVLQLTGLPETFDGTINDTASTSTLHALAAAREAWPELEVRERGLAGRTDVPPLRVYCSAEAHSSVDKACVTLGLGLGSVRRVSTDDEFRMDVSELMIGKHLRVSELPFDPKKITLITDQQRVIAHVVALRAEEEKAPEAVVAEAAVAPAEPEVIKKGKKEEEAEEGEEEKK